MIEREKQEDLQQQHGLLEANIASLRTQLRSFIHHYVGEITLDKVTLPRSYQDDQRFLTRLRATRDHIHALQQQSYRLEQEIKRAKRQRPAS